MSARHRINGTTPYTCENSAYITNIQKGHPHGSSACSLSHSCNNQGPIAYGLNT